MRLKGNYTLVERQWLAQGLPSGVVIHYDNKSCAYILTTHTPKSGSAQVEIRRVPRRYAVKFTNAQRTFNYVARRALLESGVPVKMKMRA